MVEDKDPTKDAELEKMPLQDRLKRLKELEEQKQKELQEIKRLIEKDIQTSFEEKKEAPQPEAKTDKEGSAPAALEDVVQSEKTDAAAPAAAVEYGRPLAQGKVDIGSLYEEVKKFRDEMKDVFNQGYQLNQREEGEFYQLRQMVERAELAQSYVKAPKVDNQLLNMAEQMLESIQTYRTKKKEVLSY
jgi:hypothetical protein